MKIEKIKNLFKKQKDEYYNFILQRAFDNYNDEELTIKKYERKYKSSLLNLDMDEYPVNMYDSEDLSNHSFDLGGYYAIKYVLKEIGKIKVEKKVNKISVMELLKPVICEMAEEKVIEDVCKREGCTSLNIYNNIGNIKFKYQKIFDKYYDEIYDKLNIFNKVKKV